MKRKFDFEFKQFGLTHSRCGMKIGTDGVLLGAWVGAIVDAPAHVADIGSGSGLVGLMAAQRMPLAEVDCVEIDPGACADLRENIEVSPFASRVNAVEDDFANYKPRRPLDLILSNPPYFEGGLSAPQLSRARARHQGEGLTYATLLSRAREMLAPGGRLAVVSPADAEDDMTWHATVARIAIRRLCRVSAVDGRAPSRLLWEFSVEDGPMRTESLTIRKSDNTYTPEYIKLTSPFYLNF